MLKELQEWYSVIYYYKFEVINDKLECERTETKRAMCPGEKEIRQEPVFMKKDFIVVKKKFKNYKSLNNYLVKVAENIGATDKNTIIVCVSEDILNEALYKIKVKNNKPIFPIEEKNPINNKFVNICSPGFMRNNPESLIILDESQEVLLNPLISSKHIIKVTNGEYMFGKIEKIIKYNWIIPGIIVLVFLIILLSGTYNINNHGNQNITTDVTGIENMNFKAGF